MTLNSLITKVIPYRSGVAPSDIRDSREVLEENIAIEERGLIDDESYVRARRLDPRVLDERRERIQHLRAQLEAFDASTAQEKELTVVASKSEASLRNKAQRLADLMVQARDLALDIQKEHGSIAHRIPMQRFSTPGLLPLLGSGRDDSLIHILAGRYEVVAQWLKEAQECGLSVPAAPKDQGSQSRPRQHAPMTINPWTHEKLVMDSEEQRVRRIVGTFS